MFSVLIFVSIKREDNSKLVLNDLSSINSLVNIRDVLGAFRHDESECSLYFGLSLFLKEVMVILCGKPYSITRFLKRVMFLVEIRQFDFTGLHHFRKQSEVQ